MRRKRWSPSWSGSVAEHQGRVPQPGVPAGPRNSPPPSRQSGGTSGDLSIPHYHPETPTAPYLPSGSSSSTASSSHSTASSGAATASVAAHHAAARQERLVDTYVTKAYSKKLERKGVPSLEVGARIERAKSKLEKDRERLLSHPAVEKANSEGKVVSVKSIQRLDKRTRQTHAITGPRGLETTKKFGTRVRSIAGLTEAQVNHLEKIEGVPQGEVGKTTARLRDERQAESEPSTLEALSIASLGVPGIGVGGTLAKIAEAGVPRLLASGGAKEIAKEVGERAAAKGAATKAAVQSIPEVLKASPQLAKTGAKALPSAAKATAKAAPAATGRGALRAGETTYKLGGGLSVLAATNQAGIHTAPGKAAEAILEGTEKAVTENPLGTAETTARALPAAITAPAALVYSAGRIPFDGTKPLEQTASGQIEGLKQIGENLFSGNPKKVQKAVEQEGALSLLTPLPALTRTRAYEAVRSDVRGAAAGARKLSGHGRRAPTEQNVFGFTERRQARKRVAVTHARSTNPHRVSEARHTNAILHGSTTRPALSSAPEGSHVALQTLLEYGIRNPEGVELVRKRGPKTEPHAEGKVNLDAALRYAEEHPEIFKDKAFNRALTAGERASKTTPAAVKGAGQVATHRAQGDLFGITPPEARVPVKARKFTSAKTRAEAWKDLGRMEAHIAELRGKARVKGPKGAKASRRQAVEKTLEARVDGLKKALDKYTRPDAKSLSGERMAWDKGLEREYLAEVQAAAGKSPLVSPVWTHHATYRSSKLGIEGGTLPATAGSTPKVRKGSLAEHDLVDRSLEAFVRGTVQMPRRRAGAAKFARDVAHEEKVPYTVNGKAKYVVPDSETWAKITGPKTKENPDGGQVDPKTYGRFPLRQWKTAVKDPFTEDARLEGILKDAEEGRVRGHEPSLILPREVIREFNATLNPDHAPLTEAMSKLSTGASRLILNTNPAWAAAQIPGEGIPLLLAHPELLRPALRAPIPGGKALDIMRELHAFRRDHPEEAAMIEGSAGASPVITAGSLRSPLDLERESSFNPQPAMFAKGAKAMTRGRIGRAMISTAKLEPLSLFDIKRQNAYRSVLLAAEADKQFRGFTSGVRNYFRKSAKLSEKFKGKSREELWTWLTTTKEGKKELGRLSDYVDNIQGNWTAFTRYEKAFAPLTIFYPFLRYSLRWTLWTFPKTHPLTATIAYMLGQANSNELEKVLGAKPASPLLYSYPVVKDAEGKGSVLPGGSRISPGQSALQQAAASQEAPQLLSALNPILGAGLTALGGPGPFGQKPSGPAGYAAIDQLLSLPAPLRIIMNETGVHSEEAAAALGLARKQPESVIAKAFRKLDPEKSERSLLDPALPQSGRNAKLSNQLSRGLKEAEANSKAKREEVAGDDSLTVKERQQKIAQMEVRSEKAGDTIDSVLKKLGLDKEDEEAYERFKAALYEGKQESSGGYGGTSGYESGGYESGGYGGEGKGNSKALGYKPPSAAINIPGFDLGGVTGAIGSLIGGTPAQAAVKAPGHKELPRHEPIPVKVAHRVTLKGPLTPSQKEFGKELSRLTGLHPKTIGGWLLAEDSYTAASSKESSGDANWLNIGPGYDLGSDPKKAAQYTAHLINTSHYYGGIRSTVGKGVSAQVAAIEASPWDGAHYPNGIPTDLVSGSGAGKVPRKVVTKFQAGVRAASELNKLNNKGALPYVWGGGHVSGKVSPGSGLDCSGAVSYVLQHMGVKLPGGVVSGDMGAYLKPGPGAVTVFYNGEHTFMKIGDKYFGTSHANPGGGAGFIPTSYEQGEAESGAYNVGHVAGLGKKVALQMGIPAASTGSGAGQAFPGMTIANSGTSATINEGAAVTTAKPEFSTKPIRLTPGQKLNQVNALLEGDLSRYGVPSEPKAPSVSDLAALASSLEAGRQKLRSL